MSLRAAGGPRQAPRIVLTGGGTAGHVAPALAVAEELQRLWPDVSLLYVGTDAGIEAELVARASIRFASVRVSALSGRQAMQAVNSLARAATATTASAAVLRQFRPHAALGTGGYVAGPVLAGARLIGVPSAIHEQNLRPGITNRLLGRTVRQVYVSFAASAPYFPDPRKVIFTGYPVRPAILRSTRLEGAMALGLDPERPTLLIMSGSKGALTINQAVKDGLPLLLRRFPLVQVIVSTGAAYYEDVRASLIASGLNLSPGAGVVVAPYLHEMHHAYAAADLAVCRAGGTTHELTARGLPAILVPSPNVAYDQQTGNAHVLADAGAAVVLPDASFSGATLAEAAVGLLSDLAALSAMAERSRSLGRPAAGHTIAKYLLKLAGYEESRA